MACNCQCVTGASRASCHWTVFYRIWIECSEIQQYGSSINTSWDLKSTCSRSFTYRIVSRHTTRMNVAYLNQQRWIGNFGATYWPVRSPHLNPCDFFFFVYLPNRLYSNNTSYANSDALKQAIQQYCLQISSQMLISTRTNFED